VKRLDEVVLNYSPSTDTIEIPKQSWSMVRSCLVSLRSSEIVAILLSAMLRPSKTLFIHYRNDTTIEHSERRYINKDSS
jgi:hypothetical protein